MAVYGNMLSAFPELMRTITVWTAKDKSDARTIRAVYLPSKGDTLKRQKFTNRGQGIEYFEDDYLYVGRRFADKIDIGDYFEEPNAGHISRAVGRADYVHEGGFVAYITERVTGATIATSEPLEVKEAQFA